MWNPFKRKPKTYQIEATIPLLKPPTFTWMRRGMWVMVNNKIAILHQIDSVGIEVHFVDSETGETYLVEYVPMGAARQAKYYEIPECRRKDFPIELAKEYGYGN